MAFAVNVTANVYYDNLLAGSNSGISFYRLSYDSNPADEYRGSCTYNDESGDDNDEITCTPNNEGYYERFEMSVDQYGDVHFKTAITISDYNGGNTVYSTELTIFAYEPKDYKKVGNGQDGNIGEGIDDPGNNGHWRPFTELEIDTAIPWKPYGSNLDTWVCNWTVEDEERVVEVIAPNMPARQIVYFKVILTCTMTPGIADPADYEENTLPPTLLGIVYVEPFVDVVITPPPQP